MRTPIVGERIFSLNVGTRSRRGVEQVLTPVIVVKVGRKYFTVKTDDKWALERQYRIDDWREKTEYSASARLYESEQVLLDEKEERSICSKIKATFEFGNNPTKVSLDKLRQIQAILFT